MIPNKSAHLKTTALTHPGMTGKNNEDRYGVASFVLSESDQTPVLFAMVADGVGGKQAGEIAAEIAVETILGTVEASDGTDPVGTMDQALKATSRTILERSGEGAEFAGMGTTATCAWIVGNKLYAANVGNSKLYLLRKRQLRRISIDHTWVQEALDLGILTPGQARNHPNARIITRFLGAEEVEVDVRIHLAPDETDEQMLANQGMALLPDDVLLICSDGLSDVVEDPEIEAALITRPMAVALQELTDLANARGGPDNITSIALRVPRPEAKPSGAEKSIKTKSKTRQRAPGVRLAIYLFSILVLIVLILIGWGLLQVYF